MVKETSLLQCRDRNDGELYVAEYARWNHQTEKSRRKNQNNILNN